MLRGRKRYRGFVLREYHINNKVWGVWNVPHEPWCEFTNLPCDIRCVSSRDLVVGCGCGSTTLDVVRSWALFPGKQVSCEWQLGTAFVISFGVDIKISHLVFQLPVVVKSGTFHNIFICICMDYVYIYIRSSFPCSTSISASTTIPSPEFSWQKLACWAAHRRLQT